MCKNLHAVVGSDTGTPEMRCHEGHVAPAVQTWQNNCICRGWLVPVFITRTDDIYVAAGLDAVVLLKTIEFGVQLFTPMAVLCLVIRASRYIRLLFP